MCQKLFTYLRAPEKRKAKIIGLIFFLISLCSFCSILFPSDDPEKSLNSINSLAEPDSYIPLESVTIIKVIETKVPIFINTPLPTNTPKPTFTPTATVIGSSTYDVIISYIYFNGVESNREPDEYAIIKNQGSSVINLYGWRLNAGNDGQDFYFPSYDLQPGEECRVYTNQVHSKSCGFSFWNGQALWKNSGDCGHLFDANWVEVDTYCY